VDLVEEEHLALGQRGQDRGQVTGVLDRGAAGDPDGLLELGCDDEGQCRLAESGRSGQQDMVRWGTSTFGGLENERQLVADPGLAGKLAEPAGA
jgi:hypothetical protein